MDVVTALIVFATLMAFICAKARAAVPALIAGVFAVVLFCTTPLGSGLPGALSDAAGWVGDTGAKVTQTDAER